MSVLAQTYGAHFSLAVTTVRFIMYSAQLLSNFDVLCNPSICGASRDLFNSIIWNTFFRLGCD